MSASDKRKMRQAFFDFRLTKNKSEQCSFAVHPCTAHYRIFALQKRATGLQSNDTASVPCKAELATSAKREVPRAGFMSASDKRKMLLAFFYFRLIRRSERSTAEIAPHFFRPSLFSTNSVY